MLGGVRVRRSGKQRLLGALLGVAAVVCCAYWVHPSGTGFASGPFLAPRAPAPGTHTADSAVQTPQRYAGSFGGKVAETQDARASTVQMGLGSFVKRIFGGGSSAPKEKITLEEVQTCMESWAKAAEARDIDATVGMYDPEMGRLLGTVDEAESPRRDSIPVIREYFNGFLGGNSGVKPMFPTFDKEDVFFLADDTAVYSGYYKFELTKDDVTKEVYAKFSYIVRKTKEYGVKIVTHNSGITPKGVNIKK